MNSPNIPTLFHRQRLLLGILKAIGEPVGNRDFQKLLFFYCNTVETTPSYDFVPHQYGAFSFTSYADRKKLIKAELVEDSSEAWSLTEHGKRYLKDKGEREIRLGLSWADLRGDPLVAKSYRLFPYYATRSVIAGDILAGDNFTLKRIDDLKPVPGKPGVATIGYEGHSVESYMRVLLDAGVTVLSDVRKNPLSRKFGFSKGMLSEICRELGVRYIHIPQLGIESAKRKKLENQGNYDLLFTEYRIEVLPRADIELEAIHQLVKEGHLVALTCYENAPSQCHRTCVAEALQQQFGDQCRPKHMGG